MKAEIVSTGTELLLGKNCNEDARMLCGILAGCGIDIHRYTTVGDNVNRVADAYGEALERADVVISTGGLGGTDDDVSKQAAALATSIPLKIDEDIYAYLKGRSVKSERIMRSFASIPIGSSLFKNTTGVAPGIVIPVGEKYLILLPGPPAEIKSILKNGLEDFLGKLGGASILSKGIRVYGFRESEVEETIHDLTGSSNPTVATFLKKGWIEIAVTVKSGDPSESERILEEVEKEIVGRFPEGAIGTVEERLEEALYRILKENSVTLSTAESVTGGMIADRIVGVAGVSSVFSGGTVTYSNESKTALLGVSEETVAKHGAVSEECAIEMAKGAREKFQSDVAVSTTGIAGPTGGTEKKPLGTVWFALFDGENLRTWKRVYAGERNEIRAYAAEDAMESIINHVAGQAFGR